MCIRDSLDIQGGVAVFPGYRAEDQLLEQGTQVFKDAADDAAGEEDYHAVCMPEAVEYHRKDHSPDSINRAERAVNQPLAALKIPEAQVTPEHLDAVADNTPDHKNKE